MIWVESHDKRGVPKSHFQGFARKWFEWFPLAIEFTDE